MNSGYSPSKKKRKASSKKQTNCIYIPELPYVRIVRANMGLTLNDVTPDTFFTQHLRKRVLVDEREVRGVHQHGVFLHLAQKSALTCRVSSPPGASTKSTSLARASSSSSTRQMEHRLWRAASEVLQGEKGTY